MQGENSNTNIIVFNDSSFQMSQNQTNNKPEPPKVDHSQIKSLQSSNSVPNLLATLPNSLKPFNSSQTVNSTAKIINSQNI